MSQCSVINEILKYSYSHMFTSEWVKFFLMFGVRKNESFISFQQFCINYICSVDEHQCNVAVKTELLIFLNFQKMNLKMDQIVSQHENFNVGNWQHNGLLQYNDRPILKSSFKVSDSFANLCAYFLTRAVQAKFLLGKKILISVWHIQVSLCCDWCSFTDWQQA